MYNKFSKIFLFLSMLCLSLYANAKSVKALYNTNYFFDATITFNSDSSNYSINSRIKIPLYNILFVSQGTKINNQFMNTKYQELRNDNLYASATIKNHNITFGKAEDKLNNQIIKVPVYDLFSLVFQIINDDSKLPKNFIITTGKKIYSINNQKFSKSVKDITMNNKQVTETTYSIPFHSKFITLKTIKGMDVPYYIEFIQDKKVYKLSFKKYI